MIRHHACETIEAALRNAADCHHEYEANYLNGERDEAWAAWYAAFVIGSLGSLASPSQLTKWIADAPDEEDWAASAAVHILECRHRECV